MVKLTRKNFPKKSWMSHKPNSRVWTPKKPKKSKKIFCPKNAQIMPKSVPNELLGGFYSYYANLSHSWPLMGCQLNHSVWVPFSLDNYLKTQKTDFWGAWKTLILTILWAQNSRTGVKNCAEHEFGAENLISPLFGVVPDLQNRQKSAIFKIGSKRPNQSFLGCGPYASAQMAPELFQNT